MFKKVKKRLSPVYNNIYTKELYSSNKQFEYEDIITEVEKNFEQFLTHELHKIEEILLNEEISYNTK